MAVASYGSVVVAPVASRVRRAADLQLALCALAMCALVAGCVLIASPEAPSALAQVYARELPVIRHMPAWATEWQLKTPTKATKLLGFDPFESNSNPGKASKNTLGAFESKPDQQEPLPEWATQWSEEGRNDCMPGAQCDGGNLFNPLGKVGLYVMQQTSPHYNTPYDEYRRHKCADLPGWALDECHRARDMEHGLDEFGNRTPIGEKARPMMLHEYRTHPAILRALPARLQDMRRLHLSLARQSAEVTKHPVVG